EMLRCAQDDSAGFCHPERSEGSLADLRVITSAEEVSERTPMCYNTLTNRKELAWRMKLNRGRIALILTAIIWGSALVVTKSLLQEIGPFTAAVLRFFIAWVILAPFAFRQGYRLSLAVRPTFLLFGLTGIALYIAMTNVGLVYTAASSAALVQAAIPGVTTLFSVLLLKEHVSRLQLLGIGLSIAGLLLVTGINMHQTGSAPLVG